MSESNVYTPPKVWSPSASEENKFSKINRPTSGATHDKELPVGEHPFQLYSLATPNGVKATVMFEELLEAGHSAAEYDAWVINIMEGEQFSSGFVEVNPNSKIPALLDRSEDPPQRVFESGSILLYLAEKFGAFLPEGRAARTEALNWLFWQMGAGPFLGGGFGHFYAYAPQKLEYPINRYTMEVKRQLHLLDTRLSDHEYLAGDYSIADIAAFPWYAGVLSGAVYDAAEFLAVHEYTNVRRWVDQISERPAVQRGRRVNRVWGDEAERVPERHSADDF
ncbi:MAG: glutathione-dependent disulfide-bond oxidoreductase [Nannocystaceae bacterium]|nr:glutathione-dependent disulfide-bond oxidoreductase [bacterium]